MAPRDPTFAPAISDLRRTPLADLVVTPEPSPGQGYPLDEEGHFPATTMEGEWNLRVSAVSVNIASTAAATGGEMNVTIPNLQVGDYCFVLAGSDSLARQFVLRTRNPCATVETVVLDFFNADDVTVNPDATTLYFLCIHRRITQ